jgi:hypothetical protein
LRVLHQGPHALGKLFRTRATIGQRVFDLRIVGCRKEIIEIPVNSFSAACHVMFLFRGLDLSGFAAQDDAQLANHWDRLRGNGFRLGTGREGLGIGGNRTFG